MSGWMAAAQVGGGLISGLGQYLADKENREWSERMSNTAHQREVQDLIAAGLNPILSADGKGATTPSVNVGNPLEPVGQGIADAARTLAFDQNRLDNETRMAQANSAKADAERRRTDADTILSLQAAGRGDATTRKLEAEISQVEQATKTSSAQERHTNTTIQKTEQEVAVLKAVVPFITRGSDAITQLVDWAKGGGKIGDAAYETVQKVKSIMDTHAAHPYPLIDAAKYLINLIKKHAPAVLNNLPTPRGEAWSPESGTLPP